MSESKRILQTFKGNKTDQIPFWFMRQAGRYLPEYRELRKQAGSFLDLVYNPDMATEITLQPIRRFKMDAVILFSDILIVPHALGQDLQFVQGEGPKLDPIRHEDQIQKLSIDYVDDKFEKIYQTVGKVKQKLIDEEFDQTALIGFAGSPWTVACYMVEGGGSKDFHHTKIWAYKDPVIFQKLIDVITQATIQYLKGQIKAGAEAIQLFDSWSGILDPYLFEKFVIHPTQKIVQSLKKDHPNVPVIGFPRCAGVLYTQYLEKTDVDVIAIDTQVSPSWARDNLQNKKPVQGNLDPVALLTGGDALENAAKTILNDLSSGPFVFNLGHGVIKETPPEHVQQLCEIIRGHKR